MNFLPATPLSCRLMTSKTRFLLQVHIEVDQRPRSRIEHEDVERYSSERSEKEGSRERL